MFVSSPMPAVVRGIQVYDAGRPAGYSTPVPARLVLERRGARLGRGELTLAREIHISRPSRRFAEIKDFSREAHISALKARQKAPPRVPFAFRNGQWPQGAGQSARPWPQAPVRLVPFFKLTLETSAPFAVKMSRLEKRADFLRLAKGQRCSTDGLVLQMQPRPDQGQGLRVGFTATKKLGNAVMRNRTKRRLREVARLVLPIFAKPGFDYVLIGREATASRPFALLIDDLKRALVRVHSGRPRKAETP